MMTVSTDLGSMPAAARLLKRLRTYDEGKEVVPAVPAVAPKAHTRAHNSQVVPSGSSTVSAQPAATHVPFLFARTPGWPALYDKEGVMAEAPRRKVYDMLVAEKMLV